MTSRNLSLRILYTINSSPQYILARSRSFVPVILVQQNQNSSHYDRSADATNDSNPQSHYAMVSLKICLDTICRSSPELVQDFTRDFSVYVLDPLESNSAPAPVNISNSNLGPGPRSKQTNLSVEQSRGVAVGLGLMSWALLADESDGATVTGTLITIGTGQEALEVIFALRETVAMQKASLPATLRSWGLPPEPSSKRSRVHASKSHRESKHPSKELTTSTLGDFSALRPVPPNHLRSDSVVHLQRHEGSATSEPSSTASTPASTPCETSNSATTSTLATIAAIHMRAKAKPPKPKTGTKLAAIPATESDRLLQVRETYIGPLRKKGRPKASATKGDETTGEGRNAVASGSGSGYVDVDATIRKDIETDLARVSANARSTSSSNQSAGLGAASSTSSAPTSKNFKAKATKKFLSQEANPFPFVTTPLVRRPPHPAVEPMSLLDILAFLSASSSSSDPNVQNAALLAALDAIDSTSSTSGLPVASDKASNPALVHALKQLLSACSKQIPAAGPPETQISRFHLNAQSQVHTANSQDDDIVLLDKENVNPTVFRRRAQRSHEKSKPHDTDSSDGPSRLDGAYSLSEQSTGSMPHNLKRDTRSIEGSATPDAVDSRLNMSGPKRKRTLSEFMDERESSINKSKGRGRVGADRRDAHRDPDSHTRRNSSPDTRGLRHYSRLIGSGVHERPATTSYYRTGMEVRTSPSRPQNESSRSSSHHFERGDSQLQPTTIAGSPQTSRTSASSPVRSSSAQLQAQKRYVIPEWARTKTSTQPRLSQAARRALEEVQKRNKTEKETGKKKAIFSQRQKAKIKGSKSVSPRRGARKRDNSSEQNETTTTMKYSALTEPVAASSDRPVFAVPFVTHDRIPGFSDSTSEWKTPAPSSIPTTPPRNRQTNSYSPGYACGSLFTPTPKSWGANVPGVASSPLFSPQGSSASPLHHKEKAALSPIEAVVAGKGVSGSIAWGSDLNGKRQNRIESEGDSVKDTLNQELGSALGDLDIPSSPLLNASSSDPDVDGTALTTDDATSGGRCTGDINDRDESYGYSMKQHWSGLPPSSPPPPTSPLLTPVDAEFDFRSDEEEMDDMELPVATSDAEDSPLSFEIMPYSMPNSSACSNKELTEYFDNGDLNSLLSTLDPSPLVATKNVDSDDPEMDVFDQFTNLSAQSSGSQGGENQMNMDYFDPFLENGLTDIDFTEFWETFKPLIQDHTNSSGNCEHLPAGPSFGQEDGHGLGMMNDLDHAKLAEDVQALFSGCLM